MGSPSLASVNEQAAGPVTDPEVAAERRRPALSPSRAADFKQCPLLYRFRAVDRLPEPPGSAALRGTLVHAVLERLFDLPAPERLPGTARVLLGRVWAELVAAAPELVEVVVPAQRAPEAPDPLAEWFASAGALLEVYFGMEDPRAVESEERELLVETELASGVPLRGYLDRLDVGAGGALRIVDYKTGAAPRESGEGRALFQMKFYALALLQLRGRVPEELRLVYLGAGGEELTYRPDEGELRRFERILEAIWAAVQEADRTGEFLPSTGPGCGWCAHKALCPAWGGTPPPYPGWPELRGTAPTAPFGTTPTAPFGTTPTAPFGTTPAAPGGTAPAALGATAPAAPGSTAPTAPSGTTADNPAPDRTAPGRAASGPPPRPVPVAGGMIEP
ncbi:hypothetical protein GCM10009836_07450 [Pseudonocardia ailaonensis]|uniref:PD-(D/E)XK endonuclease-like domain-containing protein n=1 Tax=Pseudonocardia ailaonensis TaxID=367279 RepID=A0ABN2MMP4_9PSEU